MVKRNIDRRTGLLALSVSAFALFPSLAVAQSAVEPEPASEAEVEAEAEENVIVVTGTLIRGEAPGGSQLISIDDEAIEALAAADPSNLLASVPQAGNFNLFTGVRGSSNFSLAVNRPTLRYLGNTSSGTNSTLVLLDGHRLPGMGILQTTPDTDAIAIGAIERVEIVTDGGSSTYGSDAVGGVINFVTRRRFDGVDAQARYGFGDDYQEVSANATVGRDWGSGSAYISYNYAWHDEIFGADRDWSRNLDYIATQAAGAPVGANVNCAVPNISLMGTRYALPGLTPGLGNRCDNSELATIFPRSSRHSAFGSLLLDDGGPVSFEVKAFYFNRENQSNGGPFTASVNVPSSSPFYIPIMGSTTPETFEFNFSPVFGNASQNQITKTESYGLTPSMSAEIGGDWQLNFLGNYGYGESEFNGQLINPVILSAAAGAGTFDPTNLGAATNAATLAAATDWFNYGLGKNTLMNARTVVDGPLFALPGGDLRAAFGAEYLYEKYEGNNTRGATAAAIEGLSLRTANRDVVSAFGEISAPVFNFVTLTASARYDDYSDFGGTFNPKIGVDIRPVDWFTVRGNWSEAFQAPSLADIALAGDNTLNVIPLSVRNFVDPNVPRAPGTDFLVVLGGVVTPLRPQEAETWSIGFDVEPPFIDGLALGATYYNIDFRGAISNAPIFLPTFYAEFPNQSTTYAEGIPALQEYLDQLTALASNPEALAALPNGINSVYSVLDGRSRNLTSLQTDGVDVYLRYNRNTEFGAIFADVSGTYILSFDRQSNPNAQAVDVVTENSRLRLTANLGAQLGNLRGQVTWNHSGSFKVTPTAANLQQSEVDDFNLFNLFFKYDVAGDSALLNDLSFTFNVDNVFDQDPPVFRGAANSLFGSAFGFTIGRVFKFGVQKRF